MGVKLDELVMALPRVSIPFNLGPEGFKYHVADGSQTLVTLSGILTHMQRHDEELKAQRERADKAEATVKKLGDELRQLGVKQALLLERADRIELSADKEAVRNTNAHRGAEVRIDALATEAEADRKKTSDLDAALAEVGRRAEKLEHRASTMSARLDAAAGMAPGPSSWKDDVDDVDDVVETVMALQGEVARIGAAVAVTNNLMDRTANEIMMRFPYKDDELVVSADTRKFQEVLHRLLTAPRPIKLTFIEGEGRDLAFQNQERQRRLAAKSKSPKKPDPPPEAIPDQTLARLTSAMSLDSIARGLSVAFIKEDARDDDDEASRVEARHTALPWCSVSCLGADLQVLETPDATLRYDL